MSEQDKNTNVFCTSVHAHTDCYRSEKFVSFGTQFPFGCDSFSLPSCSEWAVNIQRDSYASYIGHAPLLAFFAVAENESIGRVRYNFMQRMLLPCGKPPDRDQED
uniref:Splicing factor subunit n=1 Tax=Physcomitrium patens TaxID=3218 RepID=A0A7I4CNM9_PHYPA